jgi:hypothetical protein
MCILFEFKNSSALSAMESVHTDGVQPTVVLPAKVLRCFHLVCRSWWALTSDPILLVPPTARCLPQLRIYMGSPPWPWGPNFGSALRQHRQVDSYEAGLGWPWLEHWRWHALSASPSWVREIRTQKNLRNRAFAIRIKRTTKGKNARQNLCRAFLRKRTAKTAQQRFARQRVFAVRFSHARR